MALTRRRVLQRGALAAGGAAALIVVGCGDADLPQSMPQPTPDPPASPPASPQPQRAPEPERTPQPQAQAVQVEQERAAPPAQHAPAGRRLLVPDVESGDWELEDPAFDPAPGARSANGVIDGAGYRIELPAQWTGDLVLWAHGFRGLNEDGTGFSTRLRFDSVVARELILSFGFGWATSTYRVNGYVPGVGVDDLLRVKDRVAELAGAPSRTVVAGGSMGGATAQIMAQEFPEEIDAAIAICPAAGNVWVVDYLAAWHAWAHWLIGDAPAQLDTEGMIAWSRALGTVDDAGLRLTPAGEQFAALVHRFTGGDRWGFDDGLRQQWRVNFALGGVLWPALLDAGSPTPGAVIASPPSLPPVDTRSHVYDADASAAIDLERLNAEVIRIASTAARRNDPGVGVPTGVVGVPTMSVKTTGDLYTPIHLDRDFQRLVNDSGFGGNLITRTVRRAGHCAFSEAETLSTLTSVLTWLALDRAPAGENLQGALSGLGVPFTDPFDAHDPLRPPA